MSNNGIGVVGVAPKVKLLSCKFLAANGSGTDQAAIACFDYVVMLKGGGVNVRVTSNSGGGPRSLDPLQYPYALEAAIDAAGAAGILNVFAAGNSGANNDIAPYDPASFTSPNNATVAASDSSDNRAGFSNFGATSVDLAAPGVGIVSTYNGTSYASSSGTSMATPHVAGAAAFMLSQRPDLSPSQVKTMLLATVDKLSPWNGFVASGGRLNVLAAVAMAWGELPPLVSLTSPANGAAYAAPATVDLAATASDSDGGVTKVDFYANGALVGTDTTSPYTFSWASVPVGAYSLTARATGNFGVTTTSTPVAIAVTTAPTVALTGPAPGAGYTAPATASDPGGSVAQVEFFANGGLIGSDATSPYSLDWLNVAAGAYTLTARATENLGLTTTSAGVAITVAAPNTPPTVSVTGPAPGAGYTAPATVAITAAASDPGGSVAQVEFFANGGLIGSDATSPYSLDWLNVARPRAVAVEVTEDAAAIRVTTGRARFEVARHGAKFFHSVLADGTPTVDPSRTGLQISGDAGRYDLSIEHATVEDTGPVRAVVCLKGLAGPPEDPGRLHVIMRIHFFAGSATTRCDLTLRNPRAAAHPGGFWELGDDRSVLLRDVSFLAALATDTDPGEVACSPETADPLTPAAGPLELFQASSGGVHWNSRNHVDRHGNVPLAFQGYRLEMDGAVRTGLRATPIVAVTQGPRTLALSMPDFWQNFPKAIGASGDHVVLHLFPAHHPGLHELQPGEQKTHVFFVAWGEDGVSAVPLAWTRTPLRAYATPAHYCDSGAVPYLLPADRDPNRDYVALVGAALDGEASFVQKREVIDEYGWRNFCDMYADHESAYYIGPSPGISHYNNQYDAIAGCARQFMRSGDWRWWTQKRELASHVVDVDLYHTDDDKPAYNQGLFLRTAHYVDAGRSTHRSYPKAPGSSGGGPSAEHNFATGLLLHHFLAGEPDSHEAVIRLAQRVVDMDDGSKTVFRWVSRSPAGVASATNSPLYHGPGRGAGYSIAVLLDGFRLTRDPNLLEKAESLIRRCVHPRDDIQARQLLDAERRWSYTVFLHILGRYLDEKVERNELDMMYSYARQALLAYGRWMAAH